MTLWPFNKTKCAKDRKKVEDKLHDIRSPDDRLNMLSWACNLLRSNLDELQAEMVFLTTMYVLNFEAWMGKLKGIAIVRPEVIRQDAHDAKKFRLLGWAGMFIEGGLSSWLVHTIWVIWWGFGALLAFLIAFFLYALILYPVRTTVVSLEAIRKVDRFVYKPSLIVFAPSFAIFLASRLVTGSTLLFLVPVFDFFLWTTTISLLPLVGSLFVKAHLLGWSVRAASEYNKLSEEYRATKILLLTIQPEMENLKKTDDDSGNPSGGPKPELATSAPGGNDHEKQ